MTAFECYLLKKLVGTYMAGLTCKVLVCVWIIKREGADSRWKDPICVVYGYRGQSWYGL